MWVFTKTGFYTFVENQNDKSTIIFRARVHEDMTRFRDRYLSDPKPEIVNCPTYDYPWRMIVPKEVLAKAMYDATMDTDYRKFKQSVKENISETRYGFMNYLWGILLEVGMWPRKRSYTNYSSPVNSDNHRTDYNDDTPPDDGRYVSSSWWDRDRTAQSQSRRGKRGRRKGNKGNREPQKLLP